VVKSDILIIGGGPAGIAAAIAAREKGFAVAVIDAGKPPIEKACGEGLMPAGVDALKRLGVHVDPERFATFRGIRFLDGHRSARADFPGTSGIGIRRTTLHALMVESAVLACVTLVWNTVVRVLDSSQARWFFGADGI
jgi:2-polyprenyl-6-methoxyphenol hydroxylase-like FAD-dependent oxidoreductase